MTGHHASFPDLKDKSIAITGGAGGIGAATVRGFHRQGSKVAFFDIAQEAGESLSAELGEGASFFPLDLTDLERLPLVFAEAAKTVGDFDVLINNAAHDERHQMNEVTPHYWRQRMSVNLDHQFFAAQAVVPAMRRRGGGVILNFGSIAWRVGIDDAPAYMAAKAAIEGLTHSFARELGPDGIRVNCILPGFVRTARQVEKWLTPELEKQVMESQCLKRYIEPADIADMVVALSSDTARALTNQTIVVDAGWS